MFRTQDFALIEVIRFISQAFILLKRIRIPKNLHKSINIRAGFSESDGNENMSKSRKF